MIEPVGRFVLPMSPIQSRRGFGDMYFWMMTSIHNIWVEMRRHLAFAASAFAKKNIFLIPHPPSDFGFAIWSHFTQGRNFSSFFPFHRKFVQILFVFFRINLGIHASAIQYTGIASKTDLINTSLLALNIHLLHQLFTLISNLASSQFQSSFL